MHITAKADPTGVKVYRLQRACICAIVKNYVDGEGVGCKYGLFTVDFSFQKLSFSFFSVGDVRKTGILAVVCLQSFGKHQRHIDIALRLNLLPVRIDESDIHHLRLTQRPVLLPQFVRHSLTSLSIEFGFFFYIF